MAADDYYEMWFVGDYYGGSVSEVNMGSWEEIRTYQKTVYGNGPWLIAVKVYDFGGNAGLFASTLLDGAPYSTTASPNNKFRMTPNPPLDSWNTNPSHGPCGFQNAKQAGTSDKPKEIWFRLVVTAEQCDSKAWTPWPRLCQLPSMHPLGSQRTGEANSQRMQEIDSQHMGGSQQPQSPMLGGQGYDDNDNDNDDDLGYTGNDNQGSPYTPNNRGGYNGYPQAGQSQTSFFGKNSPALASQYTVQGNQMGMLPQQNGGNSWSTISGGPQSLGGMQQSTYYDSGQAPMPNYQKTQTHVIKVAIAVDDEYILIIDNTTYIGPKNTYESRSFSVIKTYTVFSTTAQADNKFRMTKDQQGPGWDTSPYFFEGKWKAQTEDICANRNYKWSSFLPEMDRMTAPRTARAMWFPNCESSASESSPSIMYFRLTANAYTP
ncbi:hypothetical protein BASA81_017361 [Batrachochytrium salamandrivorans]|nr:hypothetical protein BASA81_017361 [Batrachochytrium salamandrivorans]